MRLLMLYLRINLRGAIAYRASFVMQALGMLLSNASFVFFWWVLFLRVGRPIGGYTFQDIQFLWAVSATGLGLANIVFGNHARLSQMIVSGELDNHLLSPKSVLVGALASGTSLTAWGDLVYGFLIMLLIYGNNGRAWLIFFVGSLIAALLSTAVSVLFHALTFWLGDANAIGGTAWDFLLQFTLYPPGIYPTWLRWIMFSLIPAGLISHLPLRLIHDFDPVLAMLWLSGSLVFVLAASGLFYLGLRRYESGNLIATRM